MSAYSNESAMDTRPQVHTTTATTTTETKASYKTTELVFYVLAVAGVLIAAAVTDNGSDGQGFGADRAWFFVTLLTIGYMISRGLAKAGSYDKDHASNDYTAGTHLGR